jgi:hypothetical protein
MSRLDRTLAMAAALFVLVAAVVFGLMLPGYSHLAHPLALPGADGIARATAFNLLAFVLPGLLLAACAWRLRDRLRDRGLAPRLGAAMLLLSALAYAAQGLLPLDLDEPDAGASRLHAAAWTLWWIGFLAGATLVAARMHALRLATLGAWLLVLGAGVLAPDLLGAGISQRLAFAAWFGWMWWAAGQPRNI